MRISRITTACAAVAAVAWLGAAPAAAAPTDDTTTTFEVQAGTLDVVAPGTADLGTGSPAGAINGSLGTITVTDSRADGDSSWLASVTSTDFTTGAATASQTVLASELDYWSGPATATTGNGTFTEGQTTFADRDPLNNVTPVTAFTHTGGTGNNTASWSASISVNVPLDNEAGVYTGTVTHSVA